MSRILIKPLPRRVMVALEAQDARVTLELTIQEAEKAVAMLLEAVIVAQTPCANSLAEIIGRLH